MRRPARAGACLVVGCLGMTFTPMASVSSAAASTGDGFSAVTPVRILDTRTGLGEHGGRPARLGSAATLPLQVAGRAGVPGDADAVVLNVTAIRPTQGTFLSLEPAGTPATAISNVNAPVGGVVANLVTVKLNPTGAVDIFNGLGSVDVAADVTGYYSTAAENTYTPLVPHRILDTRLGVGAPRSPLPPGGGVDLQITGIPADAEAVVLNLTAVGATRATFLRVFPSKAGPSPGVSSLNVGSPAPEANLVTVGLGPSGRIHIENSAGDVEVVADLAGYFSPDAAGSRFTPVTAYRLFDTRVQRTVTGLTGPGPGGQVDVQVAGQGTIPASATGVVFNLTGTEPTDSTYLEAYPTPPAVNLIPLVSNINLLAGQSRAGLVSVAIGAGGRVRLRNQFGNVHMVVDVAGYYTSSSGIDHGAGPPTPSSTGVTLVTFVNNSRAPMGGTIVVVADTLADSSVSATVALAGSPHQTAVADADGNAFLSFAVGSPTVGRLVRITVVAASAPLASSKTVVIGFTPSSPVPVSSDATNFMVDAAHSGSGTTVPARARTLWQRDFGNPITYPLIVGATAFVNVDTPTVANAYSSHIFALDLKTGRTMWTSPDIPDGAYSRGLAYDQGKIFIATNDVRAFSASTGTLDWVQRATLNFSDPPTTYDGTLYLAGWNGQPVIDHDCGGRVVAINETTGDVTWTAGGDVTFFCGSGSAPTVGPQGLFVYSATQTYGFSLGGQTMWHNQGIAYGGATALTPVLHHNQLWTYNTMWGINTVLDTTNGALTRNYVTHSAPVFAGDTVLYLSGAVTGSTPPDLEARDSTTGALLWTQPSDGFNQPFVAGSVVYTQLVAGGVEGFDVRTGSLIWTGSSPAVTDLSRYQSMAAADGVLLVPTANVLSAFG